MSRLGPGSPARIARTITAFSCGVPPLTRLGRGDGDPDVGGLDDVPAQGISLDLHHVGRAGRAELVQAVGAGHYQRAVGVQTRERPGDEVERARGRRRRRAAGARPPGSSAGPSRLKIVRTPSALRTGTTWRVAAWWAGANMKPKPVSSIERATPSGPTSSRAPSASSTSAEPLSPVAERLPCLATAQPAPGGDQRGGRRDVERRAARRRCRRCRRGRGARAAPASRAARIVSARPASSSSVSPFVRSADQDRRDLRLGRLAGHDPVEHLGRLLAREIPPRGERVDRGCEDVLRHGVERRVCGLFAADARAQSPPDFGRRPNGP